jgi:hypothetical protein
MTPVYPAGASTGPTGLAHTQQQTTPHDDIRRQMKHSRRRRAMGPKGTPGPTSHTALPAETPPRLRPASDRRVGSGLAAGTRRPPPIAAH